MNNKKVIWELVGLLILSAILLSSCASNNPSVNLSQNSILRVAFQPIVQTDPALISSDSEVFISNAVYDYLVDIDAQSNPVPRLATNWQVSNGGLSYTFSLSE